MNARESVVPIKRAKKPNKSEVIRQEKVKGAAHINHKGRPVPAKQIGDDCRCVRYKCFTVLPEQQRKVIFEDFYAMETKNLQDSHLCGLITLHSVKQRRSRKRANNTNILVDYSDSEDDETLPNYEHSGSYTYKVRIRDPETGYREVLVCKKAFLSIHGISCARLRRLQESICNTTKSPSDRRGKHENRPNSLPCELQNLVENHIKSFKPRQSHYSLRQNPNRYYLPETLSVRALYRLFLEEYRIRINYKAYWRVFHKKFNIKFGLPRTDTCTTCDSLIQKISAAESDDVKASLQAERDLHLRKAQAFYDLKKTYKGRALRGEAMVICFDFMQNLPLPHVRDNLAFRCRQLWYYVFGVHNLKDDSATMYTYDESVAKKGQNEVTSLLFHYLTKVLDVTSRNLVLLSDGCPGQNKNYVMMHFLYILVHSLGLFDNITYIFPVRGHSFLPNDQDFSVISKRKAVEVAEIPEHWDAIIRTCRRNPSPFNLVKVQQRDFFNIKLSTDKFFLKNPKPAIKLKSVRMYRIQSDHKFLEVRDSYRGFWRQSIVRSKTPLTNELRLSLLHREPIQINPSKIKDLQTLSKVLTSKEHARFYESLVPLPLHTNPEPGDIDPEDNSSGCEEH